jgi:hypothetical protein
MKKILLFFLCTEQLSGGRVGTSRRRKILKFCVTGARNENLEPERFFSHTTSARVTYKLIGHFFLKTKIIHGTNNKEEKAATHKTTINYHGTLFRDSLLLYCYLFLDESWNRSSLTALRRYNILICVCWAIIPTSLSKTKIVHGTNNKEKAATYKTTINYYGTLFHDSLLFYCSLLLLLTKHGIVQVWLICDDTLRFAFSVIIPTSPRTMQSRSTKTQRFTSIPTTTGGRNLQPL